MSVGQVCLLLAILAASGFVSGLAGFGYALVATPLCSLVISPVSAVVLITLCGMAPAVQNFVAFRKEVDRPIALRMGSAALLGMPLGLLVLETVSDTPLRLTIGAVVTVIALMLLSGISIKRASNRTDLLFGFLSGVLNTSTGTNGPPIVLNLRAHQMSIPRFRGTISTLFILAQTIAVVLFGSRGRVHLDLVIVTLVSLPIQTVVVLAGQRLSLRLGQHRFDRVVLVLLLASGAAAMINALVKLLTG